MKYRIETTQGSVEFVGEHLKTMETENWHYYETKDKEIIHFRKEHMVSVIENRGVLPKYATLADALGKMAVQYLSDGEGKMTHMSMSAGEECLELLEALGIVEEISCDNYVLVQEGK